MLEENKAADEGTVAALRTQLVLNQVLARWGLEETLRLGAEGRIRYTLHGAVYDEEEPDGVAGGANDNDHGGGGGMDSSDDDGGGDIGDRDGHVQGHTHGRRSRSHDRRARRSSRSRSRDRQRDRQRDPERRRSLALSRKRRREDCDSHRYGRRHRRRYRG